MKKAINILFVFGSILSIPEAVVWYYRIFQKLFMNETLYLFLICATCFSVFAFVVFVWYKIDIHFTKHKGFIKTIERIHKKNDDIKKQISLLEAQKQINGGISLGDIGRGKIPRDYDKEIQQLKDNYINFPF